MEFVTTLLDTIPSPVFFKDVSGRYLGCNRAFEEFLGKSREEIIGKSVYDMAPIEIACKYAEKDQELFERPGGQTYEWKIKAVNGSVREVIFNKATFTDSSENVAGLIGVILDITERKRAEDALNRSEAYFRSLIENTSDIITILNADGAIRYMSPSVEHVAGYTPSELTGRNIFEYVHPDDETDATDIIARVVQNPGVILSTEFRLRHNDGSWHIFEITIQNLLENEAVKGIVINSHDITARRQAEEERERLILELRQALSEIKTLSGLLPICASCKKIRDDNGYWEQVESYVGKHSDAQFSHSICPECIKKLYPEYYKDIQGDDKP